MDRVQQAPIERDLERKIAFIVGPRQTGKTWLAKRIARGFPNSVYLNYDRREDREIVHEEAWLESTDLLILDELHKMDGWKQYLKGIYDTRNDNLKILVTGSARLDAFRKTGDSLAGRFFVHHLYPFAPSEVRAAGLDSSLDRFLERGGFPEPYLTKDPLDAERWRMQYVDSLVRTDILDFERVHEIRAVDMILELLRARVGSPCSYASISRDVGVSPNTVKKYIAILEALFIVFRVSPHSRNVARSLLKEPKLYFYDVGLVRGGDGPRFENLVAVSLLKHVHGRTDREGRRHELKYVRTKEGREVDFCLVEENQPTMLLEVKHSRSEPSKSLKHFAAKLDLNAVQVVRHLKRERVADDVEIRRGDRFLEAL